MKFSAAERELAIELCAQSASGRKYAVYVDDVLEFSGLEPGDVTVDAAQQLAIAAITRVEVIMYQNRKNLFCAARAGKWHRANSAEAECLLREGWCPGDEAELL